MKFFASERALSVPGSKYERVADDTMESECVEKGKARFVRLPRPVDL